MASRFNDMSRNGKAFQTTSFQVSLPTEIYDRLVKRANEERKSLKSVAAILLHDALIASEDVRLAKQAEREVPSE